MTSIDVGNPAFSKIIFGIFEDSNWYKADYNEADELFWGKNKVCDFLNEVKCSVDFSEYFKTEAEIGCNDQYTVKTYCGETGSSDKCLINDYVSDYTCSNKVKFTHTSHYKNKPSLEIPGKDSRCFVTKLGTTKRAG